MIFKFGDVVEIDHKFYGKIKGVVDDYSYDSESDNFNRETQKFSKSDDGYTYRVIIALQKETDTRNIFVGHKDMELINRDANVGFDETGSKNG